MTDEQYMREALVLAKEAADDGEVPVGALVVRDSDGTVVGRGRNRREVAKHALCHAEIEAIDEAAFGMYAVRHTRAVPHVRGGDHQRAARPRRVRHTPLESRVLRFDG